MVIKTYSPKTQGLRHRVGLDYRKMGVKKFKLPKSMLGNTKKRKGRGAGKSITVRHRGGGQKQKYRKVDLKGKDNRVPGIVEVIIYDPNRSANLALVKYKDGDRRLILATKKMKAGYKIDFDVDVLTDGTRMKLKDLPIGIEVSNVEIRPGSGGKIARSAGTAVFLAGFDKGYAQLKLPSGEMRLVKEDSKASVGRIGNEDVKNVKLGKAGRSRWRGIRPHVSGKAMNAVDHPHGGGKGHNPIGLAHRKTPWGKPTQGVKTRKRKNNTDQFIIKRRPKR